MQERIKKDILLQGKMEQQSQQGLDMRIIVNYPKLKKRPKLNQSVYTIQKCIKIVQRQLEKLSDYDYDVAYVCQLFNFDQSNTNHRKYQRFIIVHNQCNCGNSSINLYQKVTFYFQFLEEQNKQQESNRVNRQVSQVSQYQKLKREIDKQLHQILEHTLYPYLLRYYLDIGQVECTTCHRLCGSFLFKSQIQNISRLFCRNIASILANEDNPIKKTGKEDIRIKQK